LKYYKFKQSLSVDQKDFLDNIIISLQNNTKESEYLRRVIKDETIYNGFGEIYTTLQKRRLFKNMPTFKQPTPKKDWVDWMSYIDMKIWLGEALLSKVDKMSMSHSVEVRNPFLDYRMVDLVFTIDSQLKIGNTNKYLLKKIASKYLPKEIINRNKKGFNSPYNEWLFRYFGDKIVDIILHTNKQTQLFNDEYIKFIYTQAKNGKFKQHLYSLLVFSLWWDKRYL
jgi:asparagine synthase (glutamine-hydrolysing)